MQVAVLLEAVSVHYTVPTVRYSSLLSIPTLPTMQSKLVTTTHSLAAVERALLDRQVRLQTKQTRD